MSLTRPTGARGARSLGDAPMSDLSRKLIADGLKPKTISDDGPHAITDVRRWLARQLLDSKLSDAEAFGIVAHHPAIKQERAA